MLSHCLLSVPTVFMCCLPHLLYWLAQMPSEHSRHLCEYFLEVHIALCFKLFNLTFCRNPPNNTSIYATPLASNFIFFSESMDLPLAPKYTFTAREWESIKWCSVGFRKQEHHHANPAILPCFHVQQVSLKPQRREGARYFVAELN